MKIKEFLFFNDMTVKRLAELAGINQQTMSLLKNGVNNPSFRMATRIVNATQGVVSYQDLLPEVYNAIVNEYKKKLG